MTRNRIKQEEHESTANSTKIEEGMNKIIVIKVISKSLIE